MAKGLETCHTRKTEKLADRKSFEDENVELGAKLEAEYRTPDPAARCARRGTRTLVTGSGRREKAGAREK